MYMVAPNIDFSVLQFWGSRKKGQTPDMMRAARFLKDAINQGYNGEEAWLFPDGSFVFLPLCTKRKQKSSPYKLELAEFIHF